MKAAEVSRPEQRVELRGWQKIGIKGYGMPSNDYPQVVRDIVRGSSTATSCLGRYVDFLAGKGLDNVLLGDAVINPNGETWDGLLAAVAADLATFNGFAVHVIYNALGEITAIEPLHFEDCRLQETKENGKTYKIAMHPDWTERTTRNNKVVRVEAKNITWFDVFNPDPRVVRSQMINAGGIEKYNGQVLWVSAAGAFQYPIPIYDACITAISTDEGVDNVLYRNARNNFMLAGAYVHKRGYNADGMDDDDEFSDTLFQFQGDKNATAIMDITAESLEDKPEFIKFRGENYDKEFTATEAEITEKIYTAFKQEAWLCIRNGKVGFGGSVIADAYNVYNTETDNARRLIERNLQRLFNVWVNRLAFDGNTKIKITPLRYVSI